MKTYLRNMTVGLALVSLAGCAQLTAAEKTVCGDVAALPAKVVAVLDAADVHSPLGVLWADAKAGCAAGVPVIGVSQTWTAEIWGMVKALAPTVIPFLIGLI